MYTSEQPEVSNLPSEYPGTMRRAKAVQRIHQVTEASREAVVTIDQHTIETPARGVGLRRWESVVWLMSCAILALLYGEASHARSVPVRAPGSLSDCDNVGSRLLQRTP